jgi:hypothetical protein
MGEGLRKRGLKRARGPEDLVLRAWQADDLKPNGQAVDEAAGHRHGWEGDPVEDVREARVRRDERLVPVALGVAQPRLTPVLNRGREQLQRRAEQQVVACEDFAEG